MAAYMLIAELRVAISNPAGSCIPSARTPFYRALVINAELGRSGPRGWTVGDVTDVVLAEWTVVFRSSATSSSVVDAWTHIIGIYPLESESAVVTEQIK